jgi:hypothetical protein
MKINWKFMLSVNPISRKKKERKRFKRLNVNISIQECGRNTQHRLQDGYRLLGSAREPYSLPAGSKEQRQDSA